MFCSFFSTWLKQVPTLVIKNDKEPIKVNGEVMNWLYERKMKDTSRSPSVQQQNSNMANAVSEPEAWNISEMGGKLSESYGNLIGGSGAAVEHSGSKNFEFLNGNAASGDRTIQGIGGGDGGIRQEPGRAKSKKEELFDRQLDAYQQNRDVGLPQRRAPPK